MIRSSQASTTRLAPRCSFGALAVCVLLASSPAQAAAPVVGEATSAAPTSADAALEEGDLESARSLAIAAREADPSAARWADEAAIHERAGDLGAAIKAWKRHRKGLPAGASEARASASKKIAALEEEARGARADEPASTQRGALDAARAERLAALRPKAPPPKPAAPPPPPRERVITKWYFWLTVAAIAASAGAITGIAIQAAQEEQADDLSRAWGGGSPAPPSGLHLRF